MPVSFNTVLCDNDLDGFDGHHGLVITGQDVLQVDHLVGAANASGKPRGNSTFTVAFSARKRHASNAAAIAYCSSHAEATRGGGTFSGFGLTLVGAVCRAAVAHEAGVVTRATYEITGTKANT